MSNSHVTQGLTPGLLKGKAAWLQVTASRCPLGIPTLKMCVAHASLHLGWTLDQSLWFFAWVLANSLEAVFLVQE